MGFGAEFRNMRSVGGAPKVEVAAKEAEESAALKAQEPTGDADPDQNTFSQPFAQGDTLAVVQDPSDALPPVIPPAKEEKKTSIKINGKTFESQEEAIEYAASLERELEKKDAFLKGQESLKAPESKPTEVKKIKKIADKLFENPEEAMEELEAYILEVAEKRVEAKDSVKQAEKRQVEQVKQTWDNFYKTNADLAEWGPEVQQVVDKEWNTLQHMESNAGLAKIAELSRAYVKSITERALPKTTLNSRPAITPQGGSQSNTATSKSATEEKVSFAKQVRSTNRRTVLQDEA